MAFLNFKFKVLFILIFLTTGCQTTHFENATKHFSEYLKQHHNKNIPKKKHLFFLVPKLSCKGCRKNVYNYVEEIKKLENATLIVSADAMKYDYIPLGKVNSEKTIIDKHEELSRINFGIANTMIIVTENQTITDILEIKAKTNMSELLKNKSL